MKTPEGRLKDAIKKELKELDALVYMPVPSGYGMTTVDFLCCIKGRFVAIEAKAPGGKPTARQMLFLENVKKAGGAAFWCDSRGLFFDGLQRYGLLSRH